MYRCHNFKLAHNTVLSMQIRFCPLMYTLYTHVWLIACNASAMAVCTSVFLKMGYIYALLRCEHASPHLTGTYRYPIEYFTQHLH